MTAPKMTGRALVAALNGAGFLVVRARGSHTLLRHADGRASVVPVRFGETVGPGLLARILADVRLTPDELADLL
ncbi:MAG TPA: type II toxin-antitoxin system HicA family toxin [Longimicrobium sp.]|nr:type II toxin-antitoxin system HicA family toxin [Longimicrobium sp.]